MFKVIKVYGHDCYINAHVKLGRKHYVVSDNGYGCYIYKCNSRGKITDYLQITQIDNIMLGDVVKDETAFSQNLKKKINLFLDKSYSTGYIIYITQTWRQYASRFFSKVQKSFDKIEWVG